MSKIKYWTQLSGSFRYSFFQIAFNVLFVRCYLLLCCRICFKRSLSVKSKLTNAVCSHSDMPTITTITEYIKDNWMLKIAISPFAHDASSSFFKLRSPIINTSVFQMHSSWWINKLQLADNTTSWTFSLDFSTKHIASHRSKCVTWQNSIDVPGLPGKLPWKVCGYSELLTEGHRSSFKHSRDVLKVFTEPWCFYIYMVSQPPSHLSLFLIATFLLPLNKNIGNTMDCNAGDSRKYSTWHRLEFRHAGGKVALKRFARNKEGSVTTIWLMQKLRTLTQ